MRKIIIFFSLFLTLISCERELVDMSDVNFSSANLPYEIVIDGFIGTEKTKYIVTISKPVGVSTDSLFIPINDAIIIVNNGVDTFLFESINNWGQYKTVDSIAGIPGVIYTISVTYNNKLYTASDQIPYNSIDEVFFIFERSIGYDDDLNPIPWDDSHIGLGFNKHNFGFDKNLIVIHNYHLNEIDSLSDIAFLVPGIKAYIHKNSLPQGIFPSFTIGSGFEGAAIDTVELINLNISDAYHEYLVTVFNGTDWSSGMFSTTPGNVKTNVSEGGIGYFYAVNSKRVRVTIKDLWNE